MNRVFDRLDIAGKSDVGRIRQHNEDQFLIASLHKMMKVHDTTLDALRTAAAGAQSDAYLLMVADGVGGVAGGQAASGLAIQTVTELVNRATGCYYGLDVAQEDEFLQHLEEAVHTTHDVVRHSLGGGKRGPATTLTMVTLVWPRAYIIHVGDTRCYYLHKGALRQITRDQTMGALLVDEGVMTEEQVQRSSLDNVLSSAIGGEIEPSVGLVDLEPDDVLLICSDGLTKHVDDDRIAEILHEDSKAESTCAQLVAEALEGGGSDNVTVIVGRQAPA